eukprot:2368694-Rhodomonas_salina.2
MNPPVFFCFFWLLRWLSDCVGDAKSPVFCSSIAVNPRALGAYATSVNPRIFDANFGIASTWSGPPRGVHHSYVLDRCRSP